MNWHKLARQICLGRTVYRLWHFPAGLVRDSIAAGGPMEQLRNVSGARAMAHAAATLPTSRAPACSSRPELHFLTGRRFWFQTAFCLHTLQAHAGCVFHAVFHDDGSLHPADAARLRALFPEAELRTRTDNDARVAELLPPARFPTLHAERQQPYPNFLKLTDVHAGRRGWRLVLDSDMLFFRRPDFLLTWLDAPARPLCLRDVADAYGYPLTKMSALAGAPVPQQVNVGLCGLDSAKLDWEQLEFWARTLIARYGPRYYLEQALSAMLMAQHKTAMAPAVDYLLAPDEAECRTPRAVLHHYVGQSKRGYFRHAWRVAYLRAATAA
ncbi:MAG: glycosyl transferase family 2 [Opitutaceae bacterium]|nr:glycosyl transferase family 2 [Opitutaceae bacterium]